MSDMNGQNDTHPHGEHLSAYLDGRLDLARMRGIGVHLGRCAACAHQIARLDETRARLRRLPAPSPPPDFWPSAYRRLRADQFARAPRVTRRAWSGARTGRWAAGAAAAFAAAAGLAYTPLSHAPGPLPMPPAALLPAPDRPPDVASLAASHTDSVSRLPLADADRQKMIGADAAQPAEASDLADFADGSP